MTTKSFLILCLLPAMCLFAAACITEKSVPFTLKICFTDDGKAIFTEKNIRSVKQSKDPVSGKTITLLQLDAESTAKLEQITRNNIGRKLNITINDTLIQTSTLKEPIYTGKIRVEYP